ncbi:hypothetical protein SKP52_20355 [Sphingopyxis fribergensis]|nr:MULTISPECIES: hypothetical protein [Sphingomonadales]AGH47737.1 hypothetical protein G432_00035 [Sphingomonas sp. MM-1]AJA10937.1 hypothetical protein SKP52_20355 [Sphingopyxis fribergensis]
MDVRHFFMAGAAALAVTGMAARPSFAAEAPLSGAFALPGITEKVTAELTVRETGPLARELVIAFTDKMTGQPVTQFDEELARELHLLATDSAFSTFVHEHPEKPGPDGRFRIEVRFPKAGLYHVYADVMPKGLGQQVVRFDVPVDVEKTPVAQQSPPVAAAEGSDGPYSIELDAAALRAGAENMIALTILKDGRPATDLGLYLGVPAHAVFVSTDDLGYVHAHAMADAPKGGHHAHGQHAHGSHADPGAAIPAKLMLHAAPPRAGRYALWIQFMGGGEVRTVPFVVTVPPAP